MDGKNVFGVIPLAGVSRRATSPLCVFRVCAGGLYGSRPASVGRHVILQNQCRSCMRQDNCGWCADPDGNGVGVCMEGGLTGK